MIKKTSDTEILVMKFMIIFFNELRQTIDYNLKMYEWRDMNGELIFDYNYNYIQKEFWIRDRDRFIIRDMFQLTNEEFDKILKKWATEQFKLDIDSIFELPF
jgi:hypothetical protein